MTRLRGAGFTRMRVTVIGPGAIGLLFGGLLSHLGLDVRFLDKSKERAAYLTEHGLLLEKADGVNHLPLRVTSNAYDIGPCDVIIICVKAYNTAAVLPALPALLHAGTLVLTLQNGLGHIEVLKKALPEKQMVIGATFQGVTLVETGHIRHTGGGPTYLGSLDTDPETRKQLIKIAKGLAAAGFSTRVVKNIQGIIWNKLLINVGINALSAITRLKNGDLVRHPETRDLMAMAISEALAVGRANGLRVSSKAITEARKACLATAENRSSMLQDVLNKKPTEIEAINGAIVREAEKSGLEAPVNKVLTLLVKTIEKGDLVRLG